MRFPDGDKPDSRENRAHLAHGEHLDRIAKEVVDAAFKVHSTLGPGLLESAYEACLVYELTARGHEVECQKPLPVSYCSLLLEVGYRLDLVVDQELIVELKAVDQLLPIHQAQLLTYLKLSGKTLGLLINFNVPVIKAGIKRIALNHPSA